MPEDLGRKLFSYGVITDTHLNQGEDECNSPFAVNRLANRRMRHVVRSLNSRDLAFVVNVGDLVHPVPAIPDLYEQAAARFLEQVKELRHPLYLTPGNHDVGDKPNDWAPAAGVHEDYLALWDKHFGPQYQSFDHGDCHFVIINAQIINSGFPGEAVQRDWLEADLEANRGKRIFLFSHYPPYFSKPDEEENYDNIGEPGRSWMLGLLKSHKIEALLVGHVHNFWFYRYAETDCYLMPSTAFVRQDYSEMYRIPPLDSAEYGRNDRPKLGYFVVHVHEQGHVCEIVRTYGAEVSAGAPHETAPVTVEAVHPRENRFGDFGFDMRQNWMEVVEIPPTGGLDEFDRKEVRNDYALMALWEMGVRRLRVPMRDLLVPGNVDRLRMLAKHGHKFTLFTFGDPQPHHRKLIKANQDVFDSWEIGFNAETSERTLGGIGEIAAAVDLPVYLSRLRSIDEVRAEAGKYYHAINQGFFAHADKHEMAALLESPELKGAIDGFVFRLTMDMAPWEAVANAQAAAEELGVQASVHLRMIGANPAENTADGHGTVSRIAESICAAAVHDRVRIFADTLADNDRGYFPRQGVLDRSFNPRAGFHLIRNLNAALNTIPGKLTADGASSTTGGCILRMSTNTDQVIVGLPDANATSIELPMVGDMSIVDLATGVVSNTSNPSGDSIVAASSVRDGVSMPVIAIRR